VNVHLRDRPSALAFLWPANQALRDPEDPAPRRDVCHVARWWRDCHNGSSYNRGHIGHEPRYAASNIHHQRLIDEGLSRTWRLYRYERSGWSPVSTSR